MSAEAPPGEAGSRPGECGARCPCTSAPGPGEVLWRIRPRLGLSIAELFRGALVGAFVFSLLAGAELTWVDSAGGSSIGLSYAAAFWLVLVYGFVPALVVALTVGSLLARAMRRVARQGWHLLAFGVAGAAILAVPTLIGGAGPWGPGVLSVAVAALAGRVALWRSFVPPAAGQ